MEQQVKTILRANNLPGGFSFEENNWKNNLFYGIAALVIVAELLLAVLFLPSKVKEVMSASEEVNIIKNEAMIKEDLVSSLEQVDQNNVKREIALASSVLPSEKRVSGLVTGLTSLASSSGAVVEGLSFSPGLVSSRSATGNFQLTSTELTEQNLEMGVKSIPITMAINASESQITEFMTKIAKVSPLLGIKKMSFTSAEAKKAGQFLLSIYYQPVQAAKEGASKVNMLSDQEEAVIRNLGNIPSIVAQ